MPSPALQLRARLADPRVRRLGNYARSLATSRRRTAYLGWLYHANMGDEAMLEAYRVAFPRCDFVEVPGRVLRLPRPARRLAAARAIALGGGTLIGRHAYREALERLSAVAPDAPAVMLGTGVEDPAFHGAAEEEMRAELRRWAGPLARFASVDVRGPRSSELLAEVGVESTVVGDPALLLGDEELHDPPDARVLGVNLSVSMEIWGARPDALLDSVATALDELGDAGWRLRFVPLWPADVESATALQRRLRHPLEVVERFLSLPDLLAALRTCRAFVGQKLHAVILAAAVHVPAVMLEYHPKCRDFQRSVDRERWTLRTDAATSDALLELVTEIEADLQSQRRQLFDAVTDLRGRLRASAQRSLAALPPDLR
jgi:polysaccharide pyruvyl transferase WcaK-like protein